MDPLVSPDMKLPLLLIIFTWTLTGCAVKQRLHPFPVEAASMIQNESCNCEKITFSEGPAVTLLDQRMAAHEKIDAVMSQDGHTPVSYHLTISALHVTEKQDLLTDIGTSILSELLVDGNRQRPLFPRTFQAIRQSVDILNPFDGQQYRLTASSDGHATELALARIHDETTVPVGMMTADAARINERRYHLTDKRHWQAGWQPVKTAAETIWHHYAEGDYLLVTTNEGEEIRIFQGAAIDDVAGIDTFTGHKGIAFIPAGLPQESRRDVFLFVYGARLFRDLIDTIETLPECLDTTESAIDEECPDHVFIDHGDG